MKIVVLQCSSRSILTKICIVLSYVKFTLAPLFECFSKVAANMLCRGTVRDGRHGRTLHTYVRSQPTKLASALANLDRYLRL